MDEELIDEIHCEVERLMASSFRLGVLAGAIRPRTKGVSMIEWERTFIECNAECVVREQLLKELIEREGGGFMCDGRYYLYAKEE